MSSHSLPLVPRVLAVVGRARFAPSRESSCPSHTSQRRRPAHSTLPLDCTALAAAASVEVDDNIPIDAPTGESQGSACGILADSQAYAMMSSRKRVAYIWKVPNLKELEDDDDLARRFNGRKEAYKKYQTMKGKGIILDKGFDPNLFGNELISKLIRDQDWAEFCAHNDEPSNWELVREFYANINPELEATWVRGKRIRINAQRLNEFLRTSQDGEVVYSTVNRRNKRKNEDPRLKQICASMCGRMPEFRGSVFSDRFIRIEINPTFDFYFRKIKPISHTHEVSGLILLGLSEILLGKTVNVGEIISKTMMRRSRALLCYPNLIRRLCAEEGVNLADFREEDTIEMRGPIPLIPWEGRPEFQYALMDVSGIVAEPIEPVGPVEPVHRGSESEQSEAPSVLRGRGRRRGQGNRGGRTTRGRGRKRKQRDETGPSEQFPGGIREEEDVARQGTEAPEDIQEVSEQRTESIVDTFGSTPRDIPRAAPVRPDIFDSDAPTRTHISEYTQLIDMMRTTIEKINESRIEEKKLEIELRRIELEEKRRQKEEKRKEKRELEEKKMKAKADMEAKRLEIERLRIEADERKSREMNETMLKMIAEFSKAVQTISKQPLQPPPPTQG